MNNPNNILNNPKRLCFFDTPEGQEYSQAVEKHEKEIVNQVFTVDDAKYKSKESSEKTDGAVNRLMTGVNQKINSAVPTSLRLDTVNKNFETLGGEGGEGQITRTETLLNSLQPMSMEEWETHKKSMDYSQMPKGLAESIAAAKSISDAIAACRKFSADWKTAENKKKAGKEIDEFKSEASERIEQQAMLTVDQKQIARFEAAKKDFVLGKNNQLFPEKTDDTPENKEANNNKRGNVSEYLSGLLSTLDLEVDKQKIEKAFSDSYEKAGGDQKVKSFVDKLTSGEPSQYSKNNPDLPLDSPDPKVRAYLEGVLDSLITVDDKGNKRPPSTEDIKLVSTLYANLPDNNLSTVKTGLETLKQKLMFEHTCQQFIDAKILELYPENAEDKNLTVRRTNARYYLEGLFRSVEIASAQDSLIKELQYQYKKYSPEQIKRYVDGMLQQDQQTPSWFDTPQFQGKLEGTSEETSHFLEGLINSFAYEHDGKMIIDDTQAEWITDQLASIPIDMRGNLEHLRGVFTNLQAQHVYWLDKDEKPHLQSAREALIQQDPTINFIVETRMAAAARAFEGKPGGYETIKRFREVLLSQIVEMYAKQLEKEKTNTPPGSPPSEIKLDPLLLVTLPSPTTFESGGSAVESIPPEAEPMQKPPVALEKYAKTLLARMDGAGGAPPSHLEFYYDGKIYYAEKPPYKIYSSPQSENA